MYSKVPPTPWSIATQFQDGPDPKMDNTKFIYRPCAVDIITPHALCKGLWDYTLPVCGRFKAKLTMRPHAFNIYIQKMCPDNIRVFST